MSWLPIESAPREVRVLVRFPKSGHVEDATVYDRDDGIGFDVVLFDGEMLYEVAAHWMPYPELETDDRWELTEAGRALRGGK